MNLIYIYIYVCVRYIVIYIYIYTYIYTYIIAYRYCIFAFATWRNYFTKYDIWVMVI